MHMFEGPGASLHWREDGDPNGAPLVFANSLGTDLRLWDEILQLLPRTLRVIRFDKRGHGLSSCPAGPYRIEDLVDDAEALLEHLGIRDSAFVGLSIGGMIGQGLAARRPDLIRSLVLSNTAARMGTPEMWQARIAAIRDGGLEAVADAVMERWFSPSFLAGADLVGWRNMMLRTPVEGYIGCCEAIAGADLGAATAELALPVLGIAGALDGASPPDLVADTIATIRGARMETIPSVGHLPCVEAPAVYAKLISDFLQENGHV